MLFHKYFSLAIISLAFTVALPRVIELPSEFPTCLRVEEVPDSAVNVSTNGHEYTYHLGILPQVDFYWTEARDLLNQVRLNMTKREFKKDLPMGGYKLDYQEMPGDKGKMFRIDRYNTLSQINWADALAMEDTMYKYLFDFPNPKPFRIHGLEVVAKFGTEKVAWARMTYDDDLDAGDCSQKGWETEVRIS